MSSVNCPVICPDNVSPQLMKEGLGVVGPVFFVHKNVKNVEERFEPPLPIGMPMADHFVGKEGTFLHHPIVYC
jgi:hypothetical protein